MVFGTKPYFQHFNNQFLVQPGKEMHRNINIPIAEL